MPRPYAPRLEDTDSALGGPSTPCGTLSWRQSRTRRSISRWKHATRSSVAVVSPVAVNSSRKSSINICTSAADMIARSAPPFTKQPCGSCGSATQGAPLHAWRRLPTGKTARSRLYQSCQRQDECAPRLRCSRHDDVASCRKSTPRPQPGARSRRRSAFPVLRSITAPYRKTFALVMTQWSSTRRPKTGV